MSVVVILIDVLPTASPTDNSPIEQYSATVENSLRLPGRVLHPNGLGAARLRSHRMISNGYIQPQAAIR